MTQGLQNAFISYGRADSKAFAKQLNDRLHQEGLVAWFDFNNIPLGVDYQNQIDDGIEKADNFLFIISPHSVNSAYCNKEVELALKRNKRIIPLLHVEHISREIWQTRNPNGTEEDWDLYKKQGKHSSFANMHPAISKINWIYGREEVDDFETAVEGLLAICDRHSDYVHQHTVLLAKALEWERNQKQSKYLLVRDELEQADAWLKTAFKDEQPPCTPTDLHCEFITEGLKYAQNMMTQVFLSYADEDIQMMQQVGASLRRAGFTVWTNQTDIQTGTTFQDAINQGIEETDTIVYLLSPHSLTSEYCQQEIDYALFLNKRIIPLLVGVTKPGDIPTTLQELQYIDLTDNQTDIDYRSDESELIKILRQDAAYYHDHKMLLTQALKWKRKGQGSLLLRGYTLKRSQAWFKVGKQHQHHRPLLLHEEFITESLAHLPNSLDVFIAYCLKDISFVRRVNDGLQNQGKTTWFDLESIPSDVDLSQAIYHGIENSDAFLFVLSQDSITLPLWLDALTYADSLGKRIVMVTAQAVNSDALPVELANVPNIEFEHSSQDFTANLCDLIDILDSDRDHLKQHTRLLRRALEWDHYNREGSYLLRSKDLLQAKEWMALGTGKEPQPTPLQSQYIYASDQAQGKQRRIVMGAIAGSLVVTVGLAIWVDQERQFAVQQQHIAHEQEIRALNALAESYLLTGRQLEALTASIRSAKLIQNFSQLPQALEDDAPPRLLNVLLKIHDINRLDGHKNNISHAEYSPDGQLIASSSEDGTVKVWTKDGQLLHTLQHGESVRSVTFSPDGSHLASASADETVRLWNSAGQLITIVNIGSAARNVAFSPDGKMIASVDSSGKIRLWTLQGKELKTWQAHQKELNAVEFSPNGELLVVGSSDNTATLWSINGQLLQTLKGHQDRVWDVAFSPDGQTIASTSGDETTKLWNLDGKLQTTLTGHSNWVTSVHFTQDSAYLLTASDDQTVKLWGIDGKLLRTVQRHRGGIKSAQFSPDNEAIVTAGADAAIKIRSMQGNLSVFLQGHRSAVKGVSFSPDGQHIATASTDKTVNLWTLRGDLLTSLSAPSDLRDVIFSPDQTMILGAAYDGTVHIWDAQNQTPMFSFVAHPDQSIVKTLSFSSDGTLFATSSADGTFKIWRSDGTLQQTVPAHQPEVTDVEFSPDGQTIASVGGDKVLRLWSLDGELIQEFKGHTRWVNGLSFSPDGQTIATAGGDQTIILWNLDGSIKHSIKGHTDWVWDVAFSPNGEFVASASKDNTVKLWNSKGDLLAVLNEHRDWVRNVAFSPNSEHLVSTSADKTAILWNLKEVQELKFNQGHSKLDFLIAKGCEHLDAYLRHNQRISDYERNVCNNQKQK
ncbi:MAG: TIR domain-containing protein [Cyanobacteria bacterium P01_F01_bin.150]